MIKNKHLLIIVLIAILSILLVTQKEILAGKASGPVTIQYQTKDGFRIVGLIDIPPGTTIKKKVPLVIFLHSLGRNKTAWRNFPAEVKSLGVATLCLDLRGHGQSLLNKKDKKKYWQNFQIKEFQKYPQDVVDGINYIKNQYPEIDTNKVAIIGANIGANTAIQAGNKSKNIKNLILLSPTLSDKGLKARIPLVGYGNNPVLIMTSKNDRNSYNAATELIKYAQGEKSIKVFPYAGDGMALLQFQASSHTEIINWLKKHFINKK